jgi:hypothetical protein
MLGDFFTKPLQGYLFKKLRALILNLPPSQDYTLMADATNIPAAPSQECVGESSAGASESDQGWGSHVTPVTLLLDSNNTI